MIQTTETSGKIRPAAHRYQSSRARSGIRRWLLLYRPSRNRAWPHRFLFYFLTFFVLPVLSLAALGAYLGPDQTFGGIPAVLFILFLAIIVRTYAVRADATLGKSETSGRGIASATPGLSRWRNRRPGARCMATFCRSPE
jgi:nitrate reductase NapE component